MKVLSFFAILIALGLGSWSIAHAEGLNKDDGTQVVGTEIVRTTDANGNVVEKKIVKKIRSRNVVDFEEASIEGKVKKPNAAYLLHGADLDFKHLYRVKLNQRNRVISSYEYLR
jgi:hypothetical protein